MATRHYCHAELILTDDALDDAIQSEAVLVQSGNALLGFSKRSGGRFFLCKRRENLLGSESDAEISDVREALRAMGLCLGKCGQDPGHYLHVRRFEKHVGYPDPGGVLLLP